MDRRRAIAPGRGATGLLLGLALALGGLGCSAGSPASPVASGGDSGFDGAALPVAPAHDFTLHDQSGRAVSLSALRGQVAILAFLTSDCGPTCVLIAQQVRGALDELGRPVPVLFISADPRADTPARISTFLARTSLSGRVRYLTGTLGELQRVWRAYRIIPATDGLRAFERSASVILLDRSGRERVLFQTEQLTPEGLAHDVRKLS